MIQEGEVDAIGTTDKAAMGYSIMKWVSMPYVLQANIEGVSSVISTGAMVVDGVYLNRDERVP
jgi:hypothetical protein